MSAVGVRVNKDAGKGLKAYSDRVRDRIRDVVQRAAILLHADITESVNRKGSGRVYKRRTVTHIASRPGNPPAKDTGTLLRGIKFRQLEELVWVVVSGAEYSKSLEFGTSNMAARPFMRPALKRNREKILRMYKQAIRGAK